MPATLRDSRILGNSCPTQNKLYAQLISQSVCLSVYHLCEWVFFFLAFFFVLLFFVGGMGEYEHEIG